MIFFSSAFFHRLLGTQTFTRRWLLTYNLKHAVHSKFYVSFQPCSCLPCIIWYLFMRPFSLQPSESVEQCTVYLESLADYATGEKGSDMMFCANISCQVISFRVFHLSQCDIRQFTACLNGGSDKWRKEYIRLAVKFASINMLGNLCLMPHR